MPNKKKHGTPKTIILADDHPLILTGLESELARWPEEYLVIGKENNGQSALEAIRYHKPDLAILDIQMPELTGLQVAQEVFTEKINTRIILLTMFRELSFIHMANQYDVAGYLLKDFVLGEIKNCLDTISEGGHYLSKSLKQLTEQSSRELAELSTLSRMEKKVIRMISESKTTDEIAQLLFISPKTVENHRYRMAKKLNLEGTKNSLLKFALENKHLL